MNLPALLPCAGIAAMFGAYPIIQVAEDRSSLSGLGFPGFAFVSFFKGLRFIQRAHQ